MPFGLDITLLLMHENQYFFSCRYTHSTACVPPFLGHIDYTHGIAHSYLCCCACLFSWAAQHIIYHVSLLTVYMTHAIYIHHFSFATSHLMALTLIENLVAIFLHCSQLKIKMAKRLVK